MQFTTDNWDDIRKYYLGSFIKLKEHGDLLFRIDHVDRTRVSGTVEDGREFILYMNNENPYEIDYVLPHKSFFQYGKDACQLFRIPARQYMRGICVQNTAVSKFSPVGERSEMGALDFPVLKAFVAKQPFHSLTTAVSKHNPDGLRSFVLTPRMAFHRSTKNLYIDFTKVATVDVPSKAIILTLPIFKSEVENFLKKSGEFEIFKVQNA